MIYNKQVRGYSRNIISDVLRYFFGIPLVCKITCFCVTHSTMQGKALKALPIHFKFEQTFGFLLSINFGRQSLDADTASTVSKSRWISSVIRQKGESQKRCFKKTYQGVINFRFSENLACCVFLKHPF